MAAKKVAHVFVCQCGSGIVPFAFLVSIF